LISEYRKVAKLVQAFIIPIPKFVNDKTGRIHAECNQLGASTGRFSCRSPNLQQMPRKKSFRSCIVAPSGYRLIMADYSQIELRIAADITGDETMIKAYQNGLDLHKLTASIIIGKPVDLVTKKERQAAKAVNFGLIYAMGAEGLMNYAKEKYGVQMKLQQANDFRARFFSVYQGISAWHERVGNTVSQKARTLGHRQRIWTERAPLTQLLNTPIQGSAADIIKKALSLLPKKLKITGSKLIACVHDEIILEVPELFAKEASLILEETMIEAGKYYLKKVPVEVDVSIADSWAGK
jgi:DNA polymerase-1